MSRLPPFPLHIDHAALTWRDDTPCSRGFDDVYFSLGNGIAESTHVFIDNNALPSRWQAGGFRHFTLGETGFGTGLNFLVAAQAFLALAPADATLHFVSVEKFPLAAADFARAHAHWPELAVLADELRAVFPPACSGFHRRALAGGRVRLTLLLGDAVALLPRLQARVDAWLLDGFAPAKNADLWNSALFADIARLSAPTATFATFTAAGAVRRGLADAGFMVEKVSGYGRKRDMLRGRRGDPATGVADTGSAPSGHVAPATMPAPRAAVIGGGLAGCASARALAERGWQVTLFERNDTLAGETSGNLAGAVYPKFSLHETPQNRWYRDSYLFALARLPQVLGPPDSNAWAACGLLQLPIADGGAGDDDNAATLHAVTATGRWPDTVLRSVDADTASTLAGLRMPAGALFFPGAAWVHPPALCHALAGHANITLRTNTPAASLVQHHGKPVVNDEAFDIVVIANALAASTFPATAALPLRRVRGQVTHVAATGASRQLRSVVCHAGYVTPARGGGPGLPDVHCVGATFGPRDRDGSVRDSDHAENLAELARHCPDLHAALGGNACVIHGGRTGFRAQTPDYLPVIGQVADAQAMADTEGHVITRVPGVYVMSALGAKGIAFSLLGAEIIAALANDEPLPVDSEVAAALDPARFLVRARQRARR